MPDDVQIPIVSGVSSRSPVSSGYRPRRAREPGFRVMTVAAVAIGGVFAAGLGGWALMGRQPATVPVIEADSRPLRVRPENPGGLQVVGADEQRTGVEGLAPGPEAPAPQALRAQVQRAAPVGAAVGALAGGMPTMGSLVTGSAPAGSGPEGSAPVGSAAVGSAEGGGASTGPSEAVGLAAGSLTAGGASGAPPLPDTPARVVAPARVAGEAARPGQGGGTLVQLAAVGSEAAAHAEWERLARRMPELLGERQPVVQRAENGGRTVYRIRTGGFADMAEATGFCAKVRAKGGGCTLASF